MNTAFIHDKVVSSAADEYCPLRRVKNATRNYFPNKHTIVYAGGIWWPWKRVSREWHLTYSTCPILRFPRKYFAYSFRSKRIRYENIQWLDLVQSRGLAFRWRRTCWGPTTKNTSQGRKQAMIRQRVLIFRISPHLFDTTCPENFLALMDRRRTVLRT